MDMKKKSIDVVCCYARTDQHFLYTLRSHLSPLQREERITLWADIDIDAGDEWDQEIRRRLDTAHIILLLISPDFINSEYCYSVEMRRALERHERREARVIPIILRPVSWPDAPFSKLQALPKDATPVTRWTNTDDAFYNIVGGIRKVINRDEAERASKEGGTGQVHPTEEARLHAIQKQPSPLLSQITASPQTIVSSLPSEPPRSTPPIAQFGPTQMILRGVRLLACLMVCILYWLTIGYMTPSLLPEEILRISGSTSLIILLGGNSHKTQPFKVFIILWSLIVDWILVGMILSHVLQPNFFPLPYAVVSDVFGAFLLGVFLFLSILYFYLNFIRKWRYVNVINIRKMLEVLLTTALLTFTSQFLGASFLCFPILASIVSGSLFFYNLIGLGGTPYSDEPLGFSARLEQRLQIQLENERRSKAYSQNRKSGHIS